MLPYMIPRERFEWNRQLIIMAAYWIAGTVLQVYFQSQVGAQSDAWTWWPALLCFCLLTLSMATDYFSRRIETRVALVLGWMIVYFGVTWPILHLLGRRLVGLTEPVVPAELSHWALLRSAAGFPLVVFAMRSSKLMVKKEQVQPVRGEVTSIEEMK